MAMMIMITIIIIMMSSSGSSFGRQIKLKNVHVHMAQQK